MDPENENNENENQDSENLGGEEGEQIDNEEDNLGGGEENEEEHEGEHEGDGEEGEAEEGEDVEGEEVEGEEDEGEEVEGDEVADSQKKESVNGSQVNGEEGDHSVHSASQSNLNATGSNIDLDEEEEKEEDEEADELLPPERKVRYKLFKFINKMRINCHMNPYALDRMGNHLAMDYAKYLLNNKEDDEELNNLAKNLNFTGNFKVSTLDCFVDTDANKAGAAGINARYTDFMNEFYDVQATLVEFAQHSENILSDEFNHVGIGMAYNDTKVVVVDIFCFREAIVDVCNINVDTSIITVKGRMLNEEYGAYALRIVGASAPTKTILQITPQHITPYFTQNKQRGFTGVFNNAAPVLTESEENAAAEPKIIEVYIRVKPELIPYNKAFTDKIRFEDLVLGTRIPMENFPIDRQIKEEKRQDLRDQRQEQANLDLIAEYERKKDEEKKRRMKIDSYAYARDGDMGEIQEEPDEEGNDSDRDESLSKRSKQVNSKGISKISGDSQSYDGSGSDNIPDYEKELDDLELTNERLKEDNELIQKKIKVIYDFRKKEGREERNFFKESNINESTYADSLSSTAGLYNDLNSHKTKLDQDLKRYQQSIEEQEKRKQDVYDILMKYKQELLENAETRKGTKIPRKDMENWLTQEKNLEDQISKLRIESFTKSLEMNRLKKELKKMEDYFEGLHIIDFEQLKIENNTLTEKIEDRNEEIHKLKNKINYTVQILAHLQEKSRFVSSENSIKKNENENLKKEIIDMKKRLTEKKEENDKKALKQLNENKKIDQINSTPLKIYYKNTLNHIQELATQIDSVSKQLLVYRKNRRASKKDIVDLLQRKERMMKDFKTLPIIDDEK